MSGENAVVNINVLETEGDESFDFDELEEKLEGQLEKEFAELDFLEEDKEKIGNPDNLGEVIKDVVWEQFINQVAVTAGEDFIKENNGLHLDLRNEAHIQTTENFAQGKIATHNTEINYQERYNNWQNNFQRNEDGSVKTKTDNRTGKEKAVLRVKDRKRDPKGENYNTNYNARADFDKGRPTGKDSSSTNIDHTISAAEIIRDPQANAHMTREEQVAFANSDKNLNLIDSAANQSKGDSTMSEFLDSTRDGKKPSERFNINEEELRKKDKEAREEYKKKKEEAEKRSIEAGKKSQRQEAFRIGGKALRAVVMEMLAELVKEIIAKLVAWFKSATKKLETLLEALKNAIVSFVKNLKKTLINAADTAATTIATAILGPVVGTIKKVWTMLKQGWKSLKDAVNYIKNPENKGKPIGILLLETGKIVIAGLTGIGAILLGELIEKALTAIPVIGEILAIDIPLLGSLANIIGIFLGAVVAGIIGAIAINLIERKIEKKLKSDNISSQIEKGNEIIIIQHELQAVAANNMNQKKATAATNIQNRHVEAAVAMTETVKKISDNCKTDDESFNAVHRQNEDFFEEMGVE